jgi:hypothetical protein
MIGSAEDNPGISESTLDSTLSPSSIQEIVGEISKIAKKNTSILFSKNRIPCARAPLRSKEPALAQFSDILSKN